MLCILCKYLELEVHGSTFWSVCLFQLQNNKTQSKKLLQFYFMLQSGTHTLREQSFITWTKVLVSESLFLLKQRNTLKKKNKKNKKK